MAKTLQSEIDKLVLAKVIPEHIASDIKLYYQSNADSSQNKLFVIFAILGAILLGLGIILILAHNWDDLSTLTKTFLSFVPILIGQFFCGYSILKKSKSIAWKEGSAVFLTFSIGACISLIAQVYHISGDFDSFMLTWCLLSLPLIYLLNSSIVSLLYIVGITVYCCSTNFSSYARLDTNYWCFLLLVAVIPHYYRLLKNKQTSNFTLYHHYIVCISLLICLSIFGENNHQKAIKIAYVCLLAIFYFIGKQTYFEKQPLKFNAYYLIGKLGTIFMLFIFSFKAYWNSSMHDIDNYVSFPQEIIVALLLFLIAMGLFIYKTKINRIQNLQVIEIAFLATAIFLFFGLTMHIVANIFVLLIGISEIKRGSSQDNLGILNYGLAIITLLIICRFFDSDFSFAIRGLLFIVVGVGFFLANYLMLKKRKANEK